MTGARMLAVALIVIGGLALAYGGFSYTKDSQQAKLGPLELSIKETKTVNIPVWAGLSVLLAGVVLLVVRKP